MTDDIQVTRILTKEEAKEAIQTAIEQANNNDPLNDVQMTFAEKDDDPDGIDPSKGFTFEIEVEPPEGGWKLKAAE